MARADRKLEMNNRSMFDTLTSLSISVQLYRWDHKIQSWKSFIYYLLENNIQILYSNFLTTNLRISHVLLLFKQNFQKIFLKYLFRLKVIQDTYKKILMFKSTRDRFDSIATSSSNEQNFQRSFRLQRRNPKPFGYLFIIPWQYFLFFLPISLFFYYPRLFAPPLQQRAMLKFTVEIRPRKNRG